MGQTTLVLASGSPRRRDLLAQLGLTFDVDPPDIDEGQRAGESPELYVERLARDKAEAVLRRRPGALTLAADTSVILDGEVLGKPRDAAHAHAMLSRLQGRAHRVLTGVAVARADGTPESQVVHTTVHFRRATDAELRWYVQTGEPMDKAGAYAVQGKGGFLVQALEGSPSNVIGLPLVETLALLARAGLRLPWEGHTP